MNTFGHKVDDVRQSDDADRPLVLVDNVRPVRPVLSQLPDEGSQCGGVFYCHERLPLREDERY